MSNENYVKRVLEHGVNGQRYWSTVPYDKKCQGWIPADSNKGGILQKDIHLQGLEMMKISKEQVQHSLEQEPIGFCPYMD